MLNGREAIHSLVQRVASIPGLKIWSGEFTQPRSHCPAMHRRTTGGAPRHPPLSCDRTLFAAYLLVFHQPTIVIGDCLFATEHSEQDTAILSIEHRQFIDVD